MVDCGSCARRESCEGESCAYSVAELLAAHPDYEAALAWMIRRATRPPSLWSRAVAWTYDIAARLAPIAWRFV